MRSTPMPPAVLITPKMRACEACRALKVKCISSSNKPSSSISNSIDSAQSPCQRCSRITQPCVRLPINHHRRKRRTDARLRDLETKVSIFIDAQGASRQGDTESPPTFGLTDPSSGSRHNHQVEDQGRDFTLSTRDAADDLRVLDIVDLGIFDIQTTQRMFNFYRDEMMCKFPFVVFSPGTNADSVRHGKPVLFLSILAVTCGVLKPETSGRMITEVWKILADRTMCSGKAVVEIIQALLVMAVFYSHPKTRDDHRNYHQLIQAAATMAMDAGMGRRVSPIHYQARLFKDPWAHGGVRSSPDSAELRRTWLGVHYLSSTVATILRRPHLLRWNRYTEESIAILASASDALPSDKWLCHMVQAEHIVEEVHFQFCMDDPASSVALSDWNNEIHMKLFEKKLQQWKESVTPDMPSDLVSLTEAHTRLYIHELAMHTEHDIDNFKPPFALHPPSSMPDSCSRAGTIDISAGPSQSHQHPLPSSSQTSNSTLTDHLTICLHSIHHIFDTFLSIPALNLRAYPCLIFVRLLYAGIAFLKLNSMASESKILSSQDLMTETYLENLVKHLAQTSENGQLRYTGEFWEQVGFMKMWWDRRRKSEHDHSGLRSRVNEQQQHDVRRQHAPGAVPGTTEHSSPTDVNTNSSSNTAVGVNTNIGIDATGQGMYLEPSIDTFDMLGQFDNGLSWEWPWPSSWSVPTP